MTITNTVPSGLSRVILRWYCSQKPTKPTLFMPLQRNRPQEWLSTKLHCRVFRTTSPTNLHPLLWTLVRPLAKFSAILVGRSVRGWWYALPPKKRTIFFQAVNRNKFRILGTLTVIGTIGFMYYESHLQESPIIKRRRFIAFNQSQILEVADYQRTFFLEDFEGRIYAENHPLHQRVQNVIDRILKANQDILEISKQSWTVTVVNSEIDNALVLPNGQVFVFKGMLNLCFNDDQLGIILGHEIAHAVLGHAGEKMSHCHLIDLFTILLVAVIWAILPTDVISVLVHWMMQKVITIFTELPYSRQLELEADEIGLQFAAKACFDVRESAAFWKRLDVLEKGSGELPLKWLSTHPDHENRSNFLESKVPEAILLRQSCKCPPLPKVDPRELVVAVPVQVSGVK